MYTPCANTQLKFGVVWLCAWPIHWPVRTCNISQKTPQSTRTVTGVGKKTQINQQPLDCVKNPGLYLADVSRAFDSLLIPLPAAAQKHNVPSKSYKKKILKQGYL